MTDSNVAKDDETGTRTGGCFCGQLRYRIDGEPRAVANCHCTMCRRTSGAPYVTWLVVDKNRFRYTSTGAPTLLESSATGSRYFCSACGTPIACELTTHPDVVDVTLGSLDDPSGLQPVTDVFTDTRLDWA